MGDDDRASILARRARFIATALAGLAIAPAGIQGCGDDVVDDGQGGVPQPCLDMPPPGGGGQGGVGGQGGAQPCLIAPLGGSDPGTGGTGGAP
ncbi:MAG: hypothetical protein HOW73_32435 [Polyangiaceae bacterium]|nr:hypothetical protein [Polyangiaceae bacterium]